MRTVELLGIEKRNFISNVGNQHSISGDRNITYKLMHLNGNMTDFCGVSLTALIRCQNVKLFQPNETKSHWFLNVWLV